MRAATVFGLVAVAALLVLASTGSTLMPRPGETALQRQLLAGVFNVNLPRVRMVHQGAGWTLALCAAAAYLSNRKRFLAVAAGAAIVAHATGPLVLLVVAIKWLHAAALPALFLLSLGVGLVLKR